jgi:hypothetical protein
LFSIQPTHNKIPANELDLNHFQMPCVDNLALSVSMAVQPLLDRATTIIVGWTDFPSKGM